MSHDVHATSKTGMPAHMGDKQGFGIPNGGLLLVLISILIAIMQGSFVVKASPWNRVWPSTDSVHVTLPPSHLTPP